MFGDTQKLEQNIHNLAGTKAKYAVLIPVIASIINQKVMSTFWVISRIFWQISPEFTDNYLQNLLTIIFWILMEQQKMEHKDSKWHKKIENIT